MDKERILQQAQNMYNEGIRSYVDSEGVEVHQDKYGNQWEPGLLETWKILRAYQDEQRKKGVPIDCPSDQIMTWLGKSYAEFTFYFFEFSHPVIHNCPEKGKSIGRFTNFRWREGYPKNNLCSAPECSPVGCGNMVCKTLGEDNVANYDVEIAKLYTHINQNE